MENITFEKNVFDAYTALVCEKLPQNTSPSEYDIAVAMTDACNANAFGYIVDANGIEKLARLSAAGLPVPDIASVLGILEPDLSKYRPMYPGFPVQVLNTSEAKYRLQQQFHYMSTYGVEYVNELFGIKIDMPVYRPENEGYGENRSEHGNAKMPEKVLHILDCEELAELSRTQLERAVRMPESALAVAAALYASIGTITVAFKENICAIVDVVAENGDSDDIAACLNAVCSNPGDILKSALMSYHDGARTGGSGEEHIAMFGCMGGGREKASATGSKLPHRNLSTKMKKGYSKSIDMCDLVQLKQNLADNRALRCVPKLISYDRYSRNDVAKRAVREVLEGNVPSWNSDVEMLIGVFESSDEQYRASAGETLLKKMSERPGVLFRSISRLIRIGMPLMSIDNAVQAVSDKLSANTLIKTITVCDVDNRIAHALEGHPNERMKNRDIENEERIYRAVVAIAHRALAQKLTALDTPLKNAKVFVDEGTFSLEGSLILPNASGSAYPPVGYAHKLPSDAVRLFVWWNDPNHRCDVDLHSYIYNWDSNGEDRVHAGWNGSYNRCGMLTSGDDTVGKNAVEYIDVDIPVAVDDNATKSSGDLMLLQTIDLYYSKYDKLSDIPECAIGALAIDTIDTGRHGNPDASSRRALYDAHNVIFRDDVISSTRSVDYTLANLSARWMRIIAGNAEACINSHYTLGRYVSDLLACQKAVRVNRREDADIVLHVGRSAEEKGKDVSLFDEGFFLR